MAQHHRLVATSGTKRKRPYWREERLLGKTFLDKQSEGILRIGKDVWTRQEIIDDLHCGNMVAAINLSKVAAKLQVDSLEQLVSRFSVEDLFQETGFGVTTMYVLLCAQEAKQRDPIQWLDHKPEELVTLSTEQHRARKKQHEARREARAARRRPPRTHGHHAPMAAGSSAVS